jgi:ABC-type phosphate transport system substrate-binding protein
MSDCTGCSRRSFLAASTVAAVSAFLAACGSDASGTTGVGSVSVTVNLSDYPTLAAVGGIVRVNGASTPIAVTRVDATTYRAFSLICPHERATVAVNGTGFRCPLHGATFNANGGWIGGERTSGLFEFKVSSNSGAGTITITS